MKQNFELKLEHIENRIINLVKDTDNLLEEVKMAKKKDDYEDEYDEDIEDEGDYY